MDNRLCLTYSSSTRRQPGRGAGFQPCVRRARDPRHYTSRGVSRDIDNGRARLCSSRHRHSARTEARPPKMPQTAPREVELSGGGDPSASARWQPHLAFVGPLGPLPTWDRSTPEAIGFAHREVVSTGCDCGGPEEGREAPRGIMAGELIVRLGGLSITRSRQDTSIGQVKRGVDVRIAQRRQRADLAGVCA